MAQLTLKLKAAPEARVDLSGLVARLANLPAGGVERIVVPVGGKPVWLGDLFTVSGAGGGDVTISGGSDRLDGAGAGMTGATFTVEGDVGAGAGAGMKGGKLEIHGNAGSMLASGMKGGIIHVSGSAGDSVGAVASGHRFGMTGGNVIVDGNVGARAGDKMRRGLILVRGKTGAAAGSRMCGGTIIAEGGFGTNAGQLMRRGTLIGPHAERMQSTFADCGVHELVILQVMARGWGVELGPLAPKPFPAAVRRFAGDLAAIGKGELLLTGV